MWKVIYITGDEKLAERIQEKLTEEGFLVKIKSSLSKQYEIQVPPSEAAEAQDILNVILQS